MDLTLRTNALPAQGPLPNTTMRHQAWIHAIICAYEVVTPVLHTEVGCTPLITGGPALCVLRAPEAAGLYGCGAQLCEGC